MELCIDMRVLKGCEVKVQGWCNWGLEEPSLSLNGTVKIKLTSECSSGPVFHTMGNCGLTYQQFPAWNLGTEPGVGILNQIGN